MKEAMSSSACLEEVQKYFFSNNFTAHVVPTTTINLFYLKLNNTGGIKISAACLRSLNHQLSLLALESADIKYPSRAAVPISAGRQALRSDESLTIPLNLTSIRTSNRGRCTFLTFDDFVLQSCVSCLAVFYNTTTSSASSQLSDTPAAEPPGLRSLQASPTTTERTASVLFLLKQFNAYIFYDRVSNLTLKTVFIEELVTDCPSCEISMATGLAIRFCYNVQCSPVVTNNSVKVGTWVLVSVYYSGPELLARKELREIQVFDNGASTAFEVREVMVGTVTALQVLPADRRRTSRRTTRASTATKSRPSTQNKTSCPTCPSIDRTCVA